MVVRISGSEGISFNDEAFATEPFVTSALEDIPVFQKKIARFTGDGTWTVPAGVTYAIAHMIGGGGEGGGQPTVAANGGASSVAFASGTVQSLGGRFGARTARTGSSRAGQANSGRGGSSNNISDRDTYGNRGGDATYVVAGATVTPAESITVTVGAGGDSGSGTSFGGDGGSGYVYIEYYEEI